MARELAKQNQSIEEIAEAPNRNWAEEYGDEAFQSNIVGDLLKFNKGEWLAGQDEEEIPLGTELVAAVHILQSGWMRWEDSKPVEIIMGMRSEGFRPPPRESLGHTDKSQWGELNGKIIDPWRRTDTLLLADPQTGRIFTFSPASDGGLQAIKGLMREYGPHMRINPNDIPVVTLGSTWYKHPEYGKTYKPTLEVTDWRDVNDVSFVVADEEEEAPAPRKAAAPAAPARSAKPAPRSAPAKKQPAAKAPPPRKQAAANGRSGRTPY